MACMYTVRHMRGIPSDGPVRSMCHPRNDFVNNSDLIIAIVAICLDICLDMYLDIYLVSALLKLRVMRSVIDFDKSLI